MVSIIRRIRSRPPTCRSTGFGAFFAISTSYAAVGCRGSAIPISADIDIHVRYLFNLRSKCLFGCSGLLAVARASQDYRSRPVQNSPAVSRDTIWTAASMIGGPFLVPSELAEFTTRHQFR